MPWRALTVTSDEAGFTPSERKMLQSVQNSTSGLQTTLTTSIRMFVGGMAAAGYPVNNDGTVPDQLRPAIIADAVWRWLRSFPQLKAMATDARKNAAADAQRIYEKIVNRTYGAIEAPYGTDSTTGNWNSENRLIMRTHPVPPPSLQFQMSGTTPLYANPNAPSHVVPTNSPGIPAAPINVRTLPGTIPGSIVISWDAGLFATTYNIYRGTGPGQELALPLVQGITAANYQDLNLTAGTTYYYQVSSLNAGIESELSNEASGKPK